MCLLPFLTIIITQTTNPVILCDIKICIDVLALLSSALWNTDLEWAAATWTVYNLNVLKVLPQSFVQRCWTSLTPGTFRHAHAASYQRLGDYHFPDYHFPDFLALFENKSARAHTHTHTHNCTHTTAHTFFTRVRRTAHGWILLFLLPVHKSTMLSWKPWSVWSLVGRLTQPIKALPVADPS